MSIKGTANYIGLVPVLTNGNNISEFISLEGELFNLIPVAACNAYLLNYFGSNNPD